MGKEEEDQMRQTEKQEKRESERQRYIQTEDFHFDCLMAVFLNHVLLNHPQMCLYDTKRVTTHGFT